jgi:hypothetical protein
MLSFDGEIPGLAGVGDGDGFCSSDNTPVEVLKDPEALRATAPLAMAKELSNRPTTHARAHVLMATFLGDCLGIIPSSGDWLNFPPRTRSKCLNNEHSKRAPHNTAVQSDCQK